MTAGQRKLEGQWTGDESKAANLDQRLKNLIMAPMEVSSVQAKLKTLDALPSLLNKVTDTLNMFAHIMEIASPKAGDTSVPSTGQVDTSPAEGEKNTNQAITSQLFQRKIAKDAKKANLKKQPTPKTPQTTSAFQSSFSSSPPRSSPQNEGELIKKDKGKATMSFKDDGEEETESGEHIHFTAEKIEEQKRIEESPKAKLAKQEVEKVKNKLVDLMGIDVVTKYYKNKLSGHITLKVHRKDGTTEVIPNFKTSVMHLAEWREVVQVCPNREGKQDPLDKLNDLANKKRKITDGFHDYFRSTKKFKPSVRYEDHPTGVRSVYISPSSYPAQTGLAMASEEVVVLRCQRIGCDATFTEDNNPDDSCTYHASMATNGNIGEVVTTCERSWFQASPWGFPSGAKKEWGLSPKAKVRVLHTAQLDVTFLCNKGLICFFFMHGICFYQLRILTASGTFVS
nr:cysteine and histidine-rich domain-containing protein RAR1 [Tanacetum cinerariifolium]